MLKLLIHTFLSPKKLVLCLLVFTITVNGFAQDADSTTITVDTLVAEDDYVDSYEEAPEFDSLNLFAMPSYTPRDIPDSILQRIKSDEAFWYVNKVPKRQKSPEVDPNKKIKLPFYLQDWFRTLLWIVIIGAFLGVLVWFLIASDVKLFRKKAKQLETSEDIAISEDIFSVDYERETEKAIANENYRLAVRLMYLHALRLLSEKNIIQYKIERTNSDYLFQLSGTNYYKDFFRLTRNFEYVWYGKFDISQAAFEIIRQDHLKIKSQL